MFFSANLPIASPGTSLNGVLQEGVHACGDCEVFRSVILSIRARSCEATNLTSFAANVCMKSSFSCTFAQRPLLTAPCMSTVSVCKKNELHLVGMSEKPPCQLAESCEGPFFLCALFGTGWGAATTLCRGCLRPCKPQGRQEVLLEAGKRTMSHLRQRCNSRRPCALASAIKT